MPYSRDFAGLVCGSLPRPSSVSLPVGPRYSRSPPHRDRSRLVSLYLQARAEVCLPPLWTSMVCRLQPDEKPNKTQNHCHNRDRPAYGLDSPPKAPLFTLLEMSHRSPVIDIILLSDAGPSRKRAMTKDPSAEQRTQRLRSGRSTIPLILTLPSSWQEKQRHSEVAQYSKNHRLGESERYRNRYRCDRTQH